MTNDFLRCYAAINRNTEDRLKSTSGGIFSLLADIVIEQKGIVYGAVFDEDQCVHHIGVTSRDELSLLRGAKYAPSNISGIFPQVKEQLENGRMVLFSGTPCQIAGLKVWLGKEYDKLLLVDLVCHGVPTEQAWKAYLNYRREQDGEEEIASYINLRSKSTGWSRYGYSVEFTYRSGKTFTEITGKNSYMTAFVSNRILRPACNKCKNKGLKRVSDFTLGDFWGVWDILPELDDDRGTSLVLVHSQKGQAIWDKLKNAIDWKEITPEQACQQNPSIITPSPVHPMRDTLLKALETEGWEAIQRDILKEDAAASQKSQTSLLHKVGRKIKRSLFQHRN